jgi:membrane fusion protein
VTAYGRDVPLQAGMALEADLRLEKRTLWRWIFEPILALRGRL